MDSHYNGAIVKRSLISNSEAQCHRGDHPTDIGRLRVQLRGAVQGVGFRPFVFRLAHELGLNGWVMNSSGGAIIEVEGPGERVHGFLSRLQVEKPPRASYQHLDSVYLDPAGHESFEIRASDGAGAKTAVILPDIATCPDCLREVFDSGNRRFRYPFTNCTNCGPRFTIITALPYDRARTTMQRFRMCEACQAEYDNPHNRRFHAQPNACPDCGPQLELWDASGRTLAGRDEALKAAARVIREGRILALKGLGGFQLIVDARNEDAVRKLRIAKGREEKPLALMYPSLEMIKSACDVSSPEVLLLSSPQSPITLLRQGDAGSVSSTDVAPSVAPGNPNLGVMLPYTPLHHLLMEELRVPVVATSGNRSDETICTDEVEAVRRLHGIADFFLVHDRPIARHADDSVVRVSLGRELVLRRARGYAPLPVELEEPIPPLLAVGGHLKNSVAWSAGPNVFISPHIGDLDTAQAFDVFEQIVTTLPAIHESVPSAVACDLHPDYQSTRFAESLNLPLVRVQHHYAHVLSCMAENGLRAPVLGVAWDGTGYGADGTIWGGEFLRINVDSYSRDAHFRTFPLPGGEAAIREPRRAALGLLYEMWGERAFETSEAASLGFTRLDLEVIHSMFRSDVNSPTTSSVGRLFDAVAALTGIRLLSRFEGQAAMELEFALEGTALDATYPFTLNRDTIPLVVDWEPVLTAIIHDIGNGVAPSGVSARFHNTLAKIIVAVAQHLGLKAIALSGGCFQNRYLTEHAVQGLRDAGFAPYWHQRVPPNDGGISLGQIVAARRATLKGK